MTEEQRRLATENIALAFHWARYYGILYHANYDDVLSAALWGVVRAAICYKPNLGGFANYAYYRITGEIKDVLERRRRHLAGELSEELPSALPLPIEEAIRCEEARRLWKAVNGLNAKLKEAIELVDLAGQEQREVAGGLNVTDTAIAHRRKRAHLALARALRES